MFKAQFLNLLLCRCFQLYYLEKHPEDAEDKSSGKKPTHNPSLLNHGFPLSVSALVSFRRAPTQGLLSVTKAEVKKKNIEPFYLWPQDSFTHFIVIFHLSWFLINVVDVIRFLPNPAWSLLAVQTMSFPHPLHSYVSRPWGIKCCARGLTVPSPALL